MLSKTQTAKRLPALQASAIALLTFIAGCTSNTSLFSTPKANAGAMQPSTTPAAGQSAPEEPLPGFKSATADVNGTRIHYSIGGSGSPVILLHGFAQTSHMWRPLMSTLAQRHTVIVPDLRGTGESDKPATGYDKKNMAVDIHELAKSLGTQPAAVVGHDIGLMVGYAYAAQFPADTEKLVLMDAFLPGIGDWKSMWLLRDLWHFHFYGETPLALVTGRERIYLEHFWNDFAADRNHSVPEADRQLYARAFAQPGAVKAGFEYFRNLEQDAQDFAELAKRPLTIPVLVLAGEKSGGTFLIDQVRLVAPNVEGKVIKGSGHWLMEEAPEPTMKAINEFVK